MTTPKKTGPSMARGTSKQDYATPPEFMDAIRSKFGHIIFDLAASLDNKQSTEYYSEEGNALIQDWHQIHLNRNDPHSGFLFLNPPFADIGAWAKKCAEESQLGARILFLVPASTGSGWYWNHVKPHAHVLHLRQRITFMGAPDAYPKDMLLAVFAYGLTGESPWSWLTKEAVKLVKERTTKLKADIAAGRV